MADRADDILAACARLVPDLIEMVECRYNILHHIAGSQPAGRRTLAAALGHSERVMRDELDVLVRQGLAAVTARGVMLTPAGEELLQVLAPYLRRHQELDELARFLTRQLPVTAVVISAGDSASDAAARRELGHTAARVLERLTPSEAVVAISGGTTMAQVAQAVSFTRPNAVVVPSRGGLGEQLEYQANTIAAVLASRLQARYHQLYVPDGLSPAAMRVVADNDTRVKATVDLIRLAHVLLHGIGQAQVMAERRGLSPALVQHLLAQGAVGEALGYYYDLSGQVVYSTDSIGLSLGDMANIRAVIAVAGGAAKATAIVAVLRGRNGQRRPPVTLVTDAAAAQAMQSLIKSSQ